MDDHRESIQDDKPVPPWEQPGCFRLDCEPHRGNLIWWLACASYVLGVLVWVPWCGLILGPLDIPFNLYNMYLAKADLAQMRAGRMDPSGEKVTVSAAKLSHDGLAHSLVGTVVWGGLVLVVWWLQSRW